MEKQLEVFIMVTDGAPAAASRPRCASQRVPPPLFPLANGRRNNELRPAVCRVADRVSTGERRDKVRGVPHLVPHPPETRPSRVLEGQISHAQRMRNGHKNW